jgi:2-oxoglutarate dehydrogenase E1 component
MGPWRFISEQMEPLLSPTQRKLRYVGRSESASPATGSRKRHQEEQAEIIREALTPGAALSAKVRVMGRRKIPAVKRS